jgi:hypothetical protein
MRVCGQPIRALLPHDLIDEYLLMIRPLVRGSGRRLFDHDDHAAKLRRVDSTSTTIGVILATYQPAYHRSARSVRPRLQWRIGIATICGAPPWARGTEARDGGTQIGAVLVTATPS